MIAKGKAISHGKNAIEYALREDKKGNFFASNLIEGLDAKDILKEFEMTQAYNSRCKNKFLRFEIGIAPQDEKKLSKTDLYAICQKFSRYMGLSENQWIACTHKDTDNLHIHFIANRIDLNNKVYDTEFVSNKASKVAERIAREMGLTIANEVHKQKEHQKQNISPERQLIKTELQRIAYSELKNKHANPNAFLNALQRKHGVKVEAMKNKQDKVYGLRFHYKGETFKASEIGREFGLRSLYNHFGLKPKGQSAKAQHLTPKPTPPPQTNVVSTGLGIVGSVLSAVSAIPTDNYDATTAEEAELARLRKKKKKKKRGRGI